jgi:hypothetical protein
LSAQHSREGRGGAVGRRNMSLRICFQGGMRDCVSLGLLFAKTHQSGLNRSGRLGNGDTRAFVASSAESNPAATWPAAGNVGPHPLHARNAFWSTTPEARSKSVLNHSCILTKTTRTQQQNGPMAVRRHDKFGYGPAAIQGLPNRDVESVSISSSPIRTGG